jgi:hypothetical protein
VPKAKRRWSRELSIEGGRDYNEGAIHIGAEATVKDVTIRNRTGAAFWVFDLGDVDLPVTLENIYLENVTGAYGNLETLGAGIHAASGVEVTVTNLAASLVYGGTALIALRHESTVTLEGCLTTARVFPRLASVPDGTALTDNTSGEFTATIGNGDSSDVAVPAPVAADCGLPPVDFS